MEIGTPVARFRRKPAWTFNYRPLIKIGQPGLFVDNGGAGWLAGEIMRLHQDPASRLARLVFTICMAFAWAGGAGMLIPGVLRAAPSDGGDQAKRVDQLGRLFTALELVDKDLPRVEFDPQAVVDSVGKDPAQLG